MNQRSETHSKGGDNRGGAVRCDYKMNEQVKAITESETFNWFIMAVIFANALILALETMDDLNESFGGPDVFKRIDEVFLAVYTIEFIMKIYAEPKLYWYSTYNVFDFFILILSFLHVIVREAMPHSDDTRLEAVKFLRSLRTLRTLRTISFIPGLRVLVIALLDTVRKWMINIILLLLLVMFLFAIMGYYLFGYSSDGDTRNWGTLARGMLSLFSYVTVDGWLDLQNELDARGFGATSRIFTITFIILGHFIFTNVFIGVIIINISEATDAFKRHAEREREAIIRKKKENMMLRQHNDVRQLLERQRRGNFSNFNEMVQEFQKGLRHDDSVMTTDLGTNIIWMETFLRTLDHMDSTMYRVQQLHFEMANHLTKVLESKLKKKYETRHSVSKSGRSTHT